MFNNQNAKTKKIIRLFFSLKLDNKNKRHKDER